MLLSEAKGETAGPAVAPEARGNFVDGGAAVGTLWVAPAAVDADAGRMRSPQVIIPVDPSLRQP
jgi:hypothetical protein